MLDILCAMLRSIVWHDCVMSCQYTPFRNKEFQHTQVSVEYNHQIWMQHFSVKKKKEKNFHIKLQFLHSSATLHPQG